MAIGDIAGAIGKGLLAGHWGHGTGWGAVRSLLGALGLPGVGASSAHLAVVWGSELVTLPALEVTPPIKEWDATELAVRPRSD